MGEEIVKIQTMKEEFILWCDRYEKDIMDADRIDRGAVPGKENKRYESECGGK